MVRAGIENTVATCGTALGEGHFRLASRFAQRMILAFDSDEAGARAAERAFGFLETFPLQPVVLILPEGQDPADFVAAHGGEALRELAADAVPLVEYMLRRTLGRTDLASVEGQSAAVSAALPLIEGLSDPVRQSEYAHLLAELAGVTEASVVLALQRRMIAPARGGGRPRRSSAPRRRRGSSARCSACSRAMREIFARLAPRSVRRTLPAGPHPRPVRASWSRPAATSRRRGRQVAGRQGRAGALGSWRSSRWTARPTLEYAEDVWARLQEFALQAPERRRCVRSCRR